MTPLALNPSEKQREIFSHALSYYGMKEISGKENNPIIVEFGKRILSWINNDEISWCSTFANEMCRLSGVKGTGKANARSWINWGKKIKRDEVCLGDFVVFWRESPDSWKGHIAFVVSFDNDYVWVLGGNQSNMVNIQKYATKRILTFVRFDELLHNIETFENEF